MRLPTFAAPLALFTGAVLGSLASTASADEHAYRVVHGWPRLEEGYALGQVAAVGVDGENRVFVFHRQDPPVLVIDGDSGEVIDGWGQGLFGNPHGLEIDAQGHVWVTDTELHQVLRFTPGGELLLSVGEKGVPGLDGEHFDQPTDVAVAMDGTFYVSDGYGNNRVAKFAPDGRFLGDWGSAGEAPGQFRLPHGIALDAEGRVYVADRSNSRLQVFTGEGRFLYQKERSQVGRPWGVDVGPDGHVYIIDGGDLRPTPPDRGRALRLDREGNVLARWGSFGSYDGEFYWGHDIAAGPDGAVYVTDVHLGMRVQRFVPR